MRKNLSIEIRMNEQTIRRSGKLTDYGSLVPNRFGTFSVYDSLPLLVTNPPGSEAHQFHSTRFFVEYTIFSKCGV
jgi:hypothetical protein